MSATFDTSSPSPLPGGSIVITCVSRYVGPVPILKLAYLLCVTWCILLAAAADLHPLVLYLGVGLFGAAHTVMYPTTFSWFVMHMDMGTAQSLQIISYCFGSMVGPIVGGFLV